MFSGLKFPENKKRVRQVSSSNLSNERVQPAQPQQLGQHDSDPVNDQIE